MTLSTCEITYNKEQITFSGVITSFKFYEQIFKALASHYQENGKDAVPTFSFINVVKFDPKVIPNLVGIGIILKHYHQRRIPLNIVNSEAIGYLDFINFFRIVGDKLKISEDVHIQNNYYNLNYITGLEIYDFNEKFLGFFGNSNAPRNYRKQHKAHVYYNKSFEYYSLYNEFKDDPKKIERELEGIRTKTYEEFESNIVPKDFSSVLTDYIIDKDFYRSIIKVLSELITNAVLYSYSSCITNVHTNKYSTIISLSDFGIGLDGSVKYKNGFTRKISEHFKKTGIYKDRLCDFLMIMDCLQYSREKERENLWSLKERIKNAGGTIRIHYNTTQVIFGSNCNNCYKDVLDCAKCLFKRAKDNHEISPVRVYKNTLKGLHYEIEIKNSELIENNYIED